MGKITGVHHIAITPTPANFERTVSFYADVLGFEKTKAWKAGPNGDIGCQMVNCGDNSSLEIMAFGKTDDKVDGGLVHLAFWCDEVDEMIEKVRAEGYTVTVEPKDVTIAADPVYPIRCAFFRGPTNELIELFKEY
ncbi:MAG: VOC family protein [Clostridia bacterium]